jgi:hypothetical protein
MLLVGKRMPVVKAVTWDLSPYPLLARPRSVTCQGSVVPRSGCG